MIARVRSSDKLSSSSDGSKEVRKYGGKENQDPELRHCLHRLFNIAPSRLNSLSSSSHFCGVRYPSSLLSSNHNLHSSHEPIAPCKYRLNSGADDLFAHPSTMFAGIERAARRICLASSNCSGPGKLRATFEIFRAN